MGNTNTDKVCSLEVEVLAKHEFKFLVPNHLVNEDGMIDKKITDNITKIVDTSWDHISDCSKSIGLMDCEGLGELDEYSSLEVLDYEIQKHNFDPDDEQDLPVFGETS